MSRVFKGGRRHREKVVAKEKVIVKEKVVVGVVDSWRRRWMHFVSGKGDYGFLPRG